jgi:glycosyltransferase involved in cell wall biosynthesis
MLLSFYIPTYNRPSELSNLLKNLTSQLNEVSAKFLNQLEIIISDNASSCDLKSIVESYKEENPRLSIIYSKNTTNIGADANILDCYYKTKGSYVWLLFDDDLMYDGAVDRVLQIVSTKNYGFLRLGETIENSKGDITSPLNKIYERDNFEITAELILSLYGPTLLTGSCLVLRRPSNNLLGPISSSMGAKRPLSPLALALDAMLEYKSGLGVSGKLVRYVDANKESWSHLWPWISTVCIPLAIQEYCVLQKVSNDKKKNIISEITKDNQSLAAIMLINGRSWPPIRGDWKFILRHYLILPSFFPVLLFRLFIQFFKLIMPESISIKITKKFK